MNSKALIELAMDSLSRMNDDSRVVLHLDETMVHVPGDTREIWYLPVMNIEGDDGFYRFPEGIRDQVAWFFGQTIEGARAAVEAINLERGFTPDQARKVVLDIMVRSRHQ
jgi:hypothetical protein